MSRLHIRCPITHKVLSNADIHYDAGTLKSLWDHVMIAPCDHCDKIMK